MNIHIHHYHHIEFDEDSEFVNLVRAVHHNQQLLLQRTELIMAQLDDLMNALQAISSDVDGEVSRLQQLQDQLTQLQNSTPPEVDLSGAISLASSIRQRLEGTAQQASSATSMSTGGNDLGVAGDPSTQPSADVTSGDASAGTSSGDGSAQGSTDTTQQG